MSFLRSLVGKLPELLPFLVTLAIVIFALWVVDFVIRRRSEVRPGEWQFGRQITMLILTVIALVIVVLALPVRDETHGELLGLVGVAITAVIALSSTTFVSNAMAGILLRALNKFRPGDFIEVDEQFGGVTERGLFHTEVETEDRDLVTFPNFLLVSNPVKVVHSSGTIVSATVSLGYDAPHETVRSLLIRAADDCQLNNPFVHVLELGDFSVTYRIAGFLEDVKQLIPTRSKLRIAMLDALHSENVEIVSPTFMIQRAQAEGTKVLAGQAAAEHVVKARWADATSKDIMFDRAEAAGRIEELKQEREDLKTDIAKSQEELKDADDNDERARKQRGLELRQQRLASIERALNAAEDSLKGENSK